MVQKGDIVANIVISEDKILYFRQLFFSVLIFSLCCPGELYGQHSVANATLLGWEQRVRNFMLDRVHNYGGTHFNRGLFRDHIHPMSPEHEIDLMTYRFTLVEDYNWELAQNAYRLSIGSLNATDFAVENTIKSDININPSNSIIIEGYHAENLRTNRLLFHLGYTHNFTGNHSLGFRHTVTNEKSDLDATFFYRYGSFNDGMIEINFTFMDWGNNVVQGLAEDSRNEWNQRYDVTHQYYNSPELLGWKLISPQSGALKAELIGGLQTFSEKRVDQHADSLSYIDKEWAHYLGGLLEYSSQYFTIGLTYQRTFSKLRRFPTANTNFQNNFVNKQIANDFGLYVTGRLKSFRLEQWIWYGHNIDHLQGETVPGDLKPPGPNRDFERVPFNYVEQPIRLKSRLLFDPIDSGLKTGLEFHAQYNRPQGEKAENGVINWDFRRITTIIKDYNERITFTIGYRFNQNFYLLGGISYDLDGDEQSGAGLPKATGTPTWFDGGFGRFTISW